MPVLTMKEMSRLDGRFFVESVLPALKAAGFDGSIGVTLSDDSFSAEGGDVVIESTLNAFEALLQGKAKVEEAPAWRRKKGGPPALTVRASKRTLKRLAALQIAAPKASSSSKDIAAESDAGVRVRRMDRVRSPEGRLIKGVRPGARKRVMAPAPAVATPTTMGTTDRVQFAVQNLARFARAVLERADGIDDDENVSFADGEVRRE